MAAISRAEDQFLYASAEHTRTSLKNSSERLKFMGQPDTTWDARREMRIDQASLLLKPIHEGIQHHDIPDPIKLIAVEEKLRSLTQDQRADPPSRFGTGSGVWLVTMRYLNLNEEMVRDLRTNQGANIDDMAVELADVVHTLLHEHPKT